MRQDLRLMKLVACLAVVAATMLGAAVRSAPAAAATPCWKALLNDWYDGRIDNTYPIHCYTQALSHLPADVETYSTAHDDIFRALQNAKARLRRSGTPVTPNTEITPTASSGNTGTTPGTTPLTTPVPTTPSPGRDQGKGISHLADKLNPASPSSLPIPLLVLGALALILVAAGGAGVLIKRRQGRNSAI